MTSTRTVALRLLELVDDPLLLVVGQTAVHDLDRVVGQAEVLRQVLRAATCSVATRSANTTARAGDPLADTDAPAGARQARCTSPTVPSVRRR